MATFKAKRTSERRHRAFGNSAPKQSCSSESTHFEKPAQAAGPDRRTKLGSLLVSIAQDAGALSHEEVETINLIRDKMPAAPIVFE